MNNNQKTKTKAFIAAATIMVVVASVAMVGMQTQMFQYALAKHAARDPPVIPDYLPNVAPGCQPNVSSGCTG
ncbi:MAG: hypothetical protein WAK17_07910 [Candidatus Nitrosopolaris sp.]|jgi:hypothetical protein